MDMMHSGAMMSIPQSVLELVYMGRYNLFTVALAAHLAYGAVLGVLAGKFVRYRGSIATLRKQQVI